MLTSQEATSYDVITYLIWHKQVRLKVLILAWRLLWNRLPTKDNMMVGNIISHDNQLCVTGCGGLETDHHLFLSCPCFASLWGLARSWLDISATDPSHLHKHAIQLTYSSGGLRVRRSFLPHVWLCFVWVLWNERNNQIFKNIESPILHLLDKVKLHSFWWMKTTNINIRLSFHLWWSCPFVCLGID